MGLKTFRSKALRKFWEKNDSSGIQPEQAPKVSAILDMIDAAEELKDLKPLFRFHEYKGARKGIYSHDVSGNVRILYHFKKGDAFDLWYGDPHGQRLEKIMGKGKQP